MAQSLLHNASVTTVSSFAVPEFDGAVDNVQSLSDEPNDDQGLTAAELKAVFDKTGAEIADFINDELIPAVVAGGLTEEARQQAEECSPSAWA